MVKSAALPGRLRARPSAPPRGGPRSQGSAVRTIYFDIDDKTRELNRLLKRRKRLAAEFAERFELSWIFHENALDGAVIDPLDLKAALDHSNVEDGVLISVYQRIRNHKLALDKIQQHARDSGKSLTLTFIKEIHQTVVYGLADRKGGAYRTEIPIHRTYYHEILPPEQIAPALGKLVRDCKTKDFRQHHPFMQAAEFHYRFMQIFPFDEDTGKVGRLLLNHFFLVAGYHPLIIPDIDRQRYYDSLRSSPLILHNLVVECMERTVDLSLRLYERIAREA